METDRPGDARRAAEVEGADARHQRDAARAQQEARPLPAPEAFAEQGAGGERRRDRVQRADQRHGGAADFGHGEIGAAQIDGVDDRARKRQMGQPGRPGRQSRTTNAAATASTAAATVKRIARK